jgi:PAS domain S-box-containing protein
MKATTAVCFVLTGVALALGTGPDRRWARPVRLALGAAVLAIGAGLLAEHLFHLPLGIDEAIVRDTRTGPPAGRPAPITGLDFTLVGAALLLLDTRLRSRARPSEWLALAVGLSALLAVDGYAFGRGSLYQIPFFSAIALHTALAFLAVALALLAARPTEGLMRYVTAAGVGGSSLRRLLPIVVALPVVIGWIGLAGERAGYYDSVAELAIVVTAMVAVLGTLAFVAIAPLVEAEARTRAAERAAAERVRRLNRVYAVLSHINHAIARERNLAVLFDRTCRIAVEQGGFASAWIGLATSGPGAALTIAADAAAALDHRGALRRAVADPAFTDGPPARAIAEQRLVIAGAAAGDAALRDCAPLAALAADFGYEAVACFPLRSGGVVRGVLALGAADRAVFDADEVRLLDELAMDVGFAMDVSRKDAERARAESALRDSQARLERAVRAGNVGLWEWSVVSGAVYYSSQWKRQLGYAEHEIAPDFEAWRSRIHPDDLERAISAIGEYLRGGTPDLEIEYRCRHKDGTWRHMLAHATVLRDETGAQVALLGAHVDVTRHTELQAQFLQAQKMESLGRLAGGIAHDFNNLLTIINGTADLAIARSAAAGKADEDWRGVRDAGERAATLTRQLLAISRRQVLQVEVLDPNEVLVGIEGLLRRLIGEDVTLRVSLAGDAGRVKADAGQLEQVVVNLAVNARDAMPRGGTLTIETRRAEVVGTMMGAERSPIGPGRYVVVSVTDTGEGMDEATQARAFEPFFTTKAPGKGTGLGLSTVFDIVRQSRGALRLRSGRGEGTTFEVYLPAVEEAARRSQSGPHQAAVARGSETILVVEDEAALRTVARKILETAGYTVLVAASGEDALTQLRRAGRGVHLVLTDVVMPGMSGPALVGRLREEGSRTRILYTSGYADDWLNNRDEREERVEFLPKPYTGTTLLRKVREVLDTRPELAAGGGAV